MGQLPSWKGSPRVCRRLFVRAFKTTSANSASSTISSFHPNAGEVPSSLPAQQQCLTLGDPQDSAKHVTPTALKPLRIPRSKRLQEIKNSLAPLDSGPVPPPPLQAQPKSPAAPSLAHHRLHLGKQVLLLEHAQRSRVHEQQIHVIRLQLSQIRLYTLA